MAKYLKLFIIVLSVIILCDYKNTKQANTAHANQIIKNMDITLFEQHCADKQIDPSSSWIVVKFFGQEHGEAGLAYPNYNRVPSIDKIFSRGIFLRNRAEIEYFAKMLKQKGANCYIVEKKHFADTGFDKRLFEGF